MRNKQTGFTLIELIAGIVVIAIVTLVVTTGLGQLFRQSVDPWQQIRATEVGQSLMNEIMARRFDENSNIGNQYERCSEGSGSCTTPAPCPGDGSTPNAEEAQREQFDDVDDYNGLRLSGDELSGSSPNRYNGFEAFVCVTEKNANELKRITVTVITPQDERIEFSSIKGNW
ncbi:MULTISPECIES: type IV pilus modification PilV family protein [Idiomarina]|jgi:MSHA pilin protein MshD|uniref:Type II secretion system protein n=1 Tax=Idiomarina abyssalis TaxID=86102 RepID=A0A8I1GCW0_9GAMM|nr:MULTISPECIES: type II secretion system protein [Idiomarina]KPD21264.1 pili assembly chaperone [Idiomarina abyssalis]MBE92896.1 type II secretion system protein [Idiomarina sp.]MBH94219.1 type II secretion system protein [Idiomarina sp.]MBJ7267428.1 type II secretion system protein [Idiomarina abyssalis]MBJ7273122.1 type II secretion system protein [Idiomarina abyssalis]|tara:strand:- start:179306 stop:179821 length:516 start_codon:yes stop_codon:yes gene_type:complete